jgi:hypothetical protein
MPISRPYILSCLYQRKAPQIWNKNVRTCEAKSGYVYNLEEYTGAHPTNSEHNMAFSVVDRLCDKIKERGHIVYMDRWFSSPKIFDHLWACKTKAIGTVMLNKKEMPKQAFSVKLKKGEKTSHQRDHILAIKWKATHDVFFLTSVHEDEVVEAPSSRGAHHKIKPTTVFDYKKYKTGVDRSDQMLSYYSFARKTVEETFLSSVRPGSCHCTHLAPPPPHKKNI